MRRVRRHLSIPRLLMPFVLAAALGFLVMGAHLVQADPARHLRRRLMQGSRPQLEQQHQQRQQTPRHKFSQHQAPQQPTPHHQQQLTPQHEQQHVLQPDTAHEQQQDQQHHVSQYQHQQEASQPAQQAQKLPQQHHQLPHQDDQQPQHSQQFVRQEQQQQPGQLEQPQDQQFQRHQMNQQSQPVSNHDSVYQTFVPEAHRLNGMIPPGSSRPYPPNSPHQPPFVASESSTSSPSSTPSHPGHTVSQPMVAAAAIVQSPETQPHLKTQAEREREMTPREATELIHRRRYRPRLALDDAPNTGSTYIGNNPRLGVWHASVVDEAKTEGTDSADQVMGVAVPVADDQVNKPQETIRDIGVGGSLARQQGQEDSEVQKREVQKPEVQQPDGQQPQTQQQQQPSSDTPGSKQEQHPVYVAIPVTAIQELFGGSVGPQQQQQQDTKETTAILTTIPPSTQLGGGANSASSTPGTSAASSTTPPQGGQELQPEHITQTETKTTTTTTTATNEGESQETPQKPKDPELDTMPQPRMIPVIPAPVFPATPSPATRPLPLIPDQPQPRPEKPKKHWTVDQTVAQGKTHPMGVRPLHRRIYYPPRAELY